MSKKLTLFFSCSVRDYEREDRIKSALINLPLVDAVHVEPHDVGVEFHVFSPYSLSSLWRTVAGL